VNVQSIGKEMEKVGAFTIQLRQLESEKGKTNHKELDTPQRRKSDCR